MLLFRSIILFVVVIVISFGLFLVKYLKKKKSLIFITVIAIFHIIVIISLMWYNKNEKKRVVDEIFEINPRKIDSLEIINYKHINSFDYSTDLYFVKDSALISLFCLTLKHTKKRNTDINFRMYRTTRDVRIIIHPVTYEDLLVEVFSLDDLGTFVGLSINEYDLMYYLNEEFGFVIDKIIKQSESVKHIEKEF